MKIVLTGGPSAGKTSMVDILHRNYWDRLCVVPEAASILIRGGFPRGRDEFQQNCLQRAIYHVQVELERSALYDEFGRSVICDRGTLDGLAYWSQGEDSFFRAIGSTMAVELARYQWVIHLDTAPPHGYESTSIRTETHEDASILNEKVKDAWRHHPNRLIIPNKHDFITKVSTALKIVHRILDGHCLQDIEEHLAIDNKELSTYSMGAEKKTIIA